MFKTDKRIFVIILLILISAFITPTCYANSAEPPSLIIIVPNAPDDLEIYIGSSDFMNKTDKIIETYYTYYDRNLRSNQQYSLHVTSGDGTFEFVFREQLKEYNNIFTLDLQNQTLTPGKTISRSIRLVALRIALTLLIEALVFLFFGYRKLKSWIAFLLINLLTQGALNIWLNGFNPLDGYLIAVLIFGEFLVFMVEIAAFSLLVKEHRSLRTISYVLLANLLSLIVGGYVITILPI